MKHLNFQKKLNIFIPFAEQMPGVTVIHDIDGFKPVYMTSKGLDLLGLTLEELIEIGEDYQKLFFNEDFMSGFLEKLMEMIKKGEETESYTFVHQVQLQGEFKWYISSIKIFHTDKKKNPTHTITTAFPVDHLPRATKRAKRLLEEELFCKENADRFDRLSTREKEVLQKVAKGKTSAQIAECLNISVDTVNFHRMAIKQKLGISSTYDFFEYARCFDLI